MVLSTSKNAAAVRSVCGTSAGPLSPAATAAAAAACPARTAESRDVAASSTPGVSVAPLGAPDPVGDSGPPGSCSPTTVAPPEGILYVQPTGAHRREPARFPGRRDRRAGTVPARPGAAVQPPIETPGSGPTGGTWIGGRSPVPLPPPFD